MVHSEGKHATTKLYWAIAAVLCIITVLEWAIFKMEHIRTNGMIMIPSLLVLSLAKFVLVCGWYMHLRYDHKWLWQIFTISALFAGFIFMILLLVV